MFSSSVISLRKRTQTQWGNATRERPKLFGRGTKEDDPSIKKKGESAAPGKKDIISIRKTKAGDSKGYVREGLHKKEVGNGVPPSGRNRWRGEGGGTQSL